MSESDDMAAGVQMVIDEGFPDYVSEDGRKEWYNEQGLYHRLDGPAIIFPDGTKSWYENGIHQYSIITSLWTDIHKNVDLRKLDPKIYAGTMLWGFSGVNLNAQYCGIFPQQINVQMNV